MERVERYFDGYKWQSKNRLAEIGQPVNVERGIGCKALRLLSLWNN